MMSFVHLHCHTHYSLLDGLPKPIDYIKKAKSFGSPGLAITDHGNLYGAIEFYRQAKEHDLNPIIGIEAYTARTNRHSKQAGIDNQMGHIILLARDKTGYENLLGLSTYSHLEGFYYKPRIDLELLSEYSKGLIILTGCLNGDVPRHLLSNDWEGAERLLNDYKSLIGAENVYLELQDHPQLMEQRILNDRLLELSIRTGTELVATNDCHCLDEADTEAHDILLCVQTGASVEKEDRFRIDGNISMRSPEIMAKAFRDHPRAIQNTIEISRQCSLKLQMDKNLIPAFQAPDQKLPHIYLRELCERGLTERYGGSSNESITDRLDYELNVIHKMGFDTYFLIVHDFIAFARRSGILVGPGRGSAAGSIVAYCLKITDIDPIKYNLLFERFLNPERISMPDIDIDFADNRRDEVLDYVIQKYGKNHVAQIITFGTMAARASVRDVGRALGLPYSEVDVIAKLIPARPGIKLEDALLEEPDLRTQYDASPSVKRLLNLALKLEGVVRHASVHACAVVISDEPLIHHTPLQMAPGGQNAVITQYSMHDIEAIGLLKMDFLGLKNLTILDYALKIIERTKGISVNLDQIPLDDRKTFELMAQGETTGVFQFESAGMRRYLKELKPSRFEDLIAMNALYRPGPMDWIPSYIQGKHHPEKVRYLHGSFKPILEETYGVAVYQEQILQLAQLFAGFSLGEADILRKAVGKKKASLLAEQRSQFIRGAEQQGHSLEFASEVFDKVIEPFAGYGFNKAHATCYAMIAYRTAYLKSHFPAEFMAALMTSDRDNTDRIVIEINEVESMGMHVLSPSINTSMANFTVVDDQNIRFGLAAIKGVGISTIREILSVRDNGGPFLSIDDFARRVPYAVLNKKALEALAYSGALDVFGERRAIVSSIEAISRHSRQCQSHCSSSQTDIFSMLEEENKAFPTFLLPEVSPASHLQCLTWEKAYLGLYVSGHPLQGLAKYLKRKVNLLSDLNRQKVGKLVKVAGILAHVKKITTKSNASMAYLRLEDPTGSIEVTVFPQIYSAFRDIFVVDGVVILTGKLEFRRGLLQLICQSIQSVSLETMISKAKEAKLYDPNERFVIQSDRPAPPSEEDSEVMVNSPEMPSTTLSSPLIITLDGKQSSEASLKELKKLFLRHRGTRSVELQIPQGGLLKRIKVPFGIEVTEDFQVSLASILKE